MKGPGPLRAGVLVLCLFFLSACGSDWEKKFIRKKEKPPRPPQFAVEGAPRPYPELYREHFKLWKNWHRQLIEDLGINRKREIRDAREARRHLEILEKYLKDEEKKKVRDLVARFDTVTDPIFRGRLDRHEYGMLAGRLESLGLRIERTLHFKKMEPHFLPTPVPMDLGKYEGEEPLPLEETPGSADSHRDGSDTISYDEFRKLPL